MPFLQCHFWHSGVQRHPLRRGEIGELIQLTHVLSFSMLLTLFIPVALLPMLTQGDTCTLHELHGCLESLQSVTQNNDLVFGTTKTDLLAVCRTLKDSVECVDEHMKNCFSPTQTKVFNHVVAGARQFLVELCVPGPIQENYLTHSPCYKNVSLSEEKCAPKYRHLIHLSENVDAQKNVDEGLRESCCAFNAFVQCKSFYVRKDCGQEAADFLEQHLDRISSPLLHEHCAHYTYASDSCASSSSHMLSTDLASTLILACIISIINLAVDSRRNNSIKKWL